MTRQLIFLSFAFVKVVAFSSSSSSISKTTSPVFQTQKGRSGTLFAAVKYTPGKELFPEKGSSYVPTGMTAAEYAKIKEDEKEKISKLNFGMWGPRFKQTNRPDGDWMIVPSLWTSGFQSDGGQSNKVGKGQLKSYGDGTQNTPSLKEQIMDLVQKYGPAYLMAYLLLDVLISTFAVIRTSKPAWENVAMLGARVLTRRTQDGLALVKFTGLWEAAKIVAGAALVPPTKKYLEYANRRWLWSPKRTIITSVLVATGITMTVGMLMIAATLFLPSIRSMVLG